ncbi:ANTAR domain-containing protein [Streptomyces sp. NPDC005408]|uniref:ANTAR domain-containing protein n=1 Tax=Streptomyces sp. NPDC005408 TaxID=3155341 RepID=UPI0033A38161
MVSDRMAALLDELAVRRTDGLDASFAGRCCAVLGVDGLAVTLSSSGYEGELVWSGDPLSAQLDDLQFTLGEGPSTDAARGGVLILESDLLLVPAVRWPGFLDAVRSLEMRAVFAVPLQIGAIQVGVFTCRRSEAGPLGNSALTDALVLADALTLVLLGDVAIGFAELAALHRAEVHQATGMISVRLGVAPAIALVRLRAYAFAAERPILDVAKDVVARKLHFPADGTARGENEDNGTQRPDGCG